MDQQSEPFTFNVGSRSSQLALIQTKTVIRKLEQFYSNNPDHLVDPDGRYKNGIKFNIIPMTTSGDQILDKALPEIGSKSLFTRELEVALLMGQVDFVVHSLKDLPTSLPVGCAIGATLERDDPNDTLVIKNSLSTKLDPMSLLLDTKIKRRIGTSSLRRIAMLRRINPSLECVNIRGNLNTRLSKLDKEDGEYDAIVLAQAGLERMNWSDRAEFKLTPELDNQLNDWCYAVGQGAIAVECRIDDELVLDLLAPISDFKTTLEVVAERSLMRKLEGGCSVPLGVRAQWLDTESDNRELSLKAIVLSLNGKEVVKANDSVSLQKHKKTGQSVSRNDLMHVSTGIILASSTRELDRRVDELVTCSELGVCVAIKMIEMGCLKLLNCK